MKTKNNDFRYFYEHQLLPQALFRDPDGVILSALDNKEYFLRLYKTVAEQNNCECPFTLESFSVFPNAVKTRFDDGDFWLIEICSPIPDEEPLCYRIYIAFSIFKGQQKAENVRYFTVEKGTNVATKEDTMFLGEWSHEGKHLNYGQVKFSDDFTLQIIQEIGKVAQIYTGRKDNEVIIPKNLKEIQQPDHPTVIKCPRCGSGVCYNYKPPKKILFVCPSCHLCRFLERNDDEDNQEENQLGIVNLDNKKADN